jgi:3-phosphoshikimate 1-carboxyvinyltransferase
MIFAGGSVIAPFTADSCGDHRIAMSMLIASLVSSGECRVNDTECIATSFPNFKILLDQVAVR